MKIPQEFDTIRPWEPEDLPEVFDRLLSNDQFKQVLAYLYPQVPFEMIAQKLKACKTNLDFQLAFAYDFVQGILKKAATGCEMDCAAIDNTRNYTFISNHRDIVLDSAFLDVMLIDNGFKTTCEIAIGDNLLSLSWVKDLVRVNKAFIVERALSMRQMLMSSKRLSDYMHFAIKEKNENIWIAQREGRAKDSDDRTQKSILQMMAMGGEGSIIERLKQLHLVPLSISYEYDPCDFLKAKEYQQKRDVEGWKKGPMDDLISMQTGIFGYKGHVHYHAAPCIDEYLDTLDLRCRSRNSSIPLLLISTTRYIATTISIQAIMWRSISWRIPRLMLLNIHRKIRLASRNISQDSWQRLNFLTRMKPS